MTYIHVGTYLVTFSLVISTFSYCSQHLLKRQLKFVNEKNRSVANFSRKSLNNPFLTILDTLLTKIHLLRFSKTYFICIYLSAIPILVSDTDV